MTSDPREKSTVSLNKILIEIDDNPLPWLENNEFISALKSQGKLAKFEDADRNITGCSLNTLKLSAYKVLDDGFDGLNLRRIKAKEAIEREAAKKLRPKPSSRLALSEKVIEQSAQIKALEARNMTLTHYMVELQSLTAKAVRSSGSDADIIRHQRDLNVIHAKLSASGESSLIVLTEVLDGS